MTRRITRTVTLGKLQLGSGHPVAVQSMCNTRTSDAANSIEQIDRLAALGCEIIRLSADTPEDVAALKAICAHSPIPVVADIQFSVEAALGALDSGVACVRLNPGIVRDDGKIVAVAKKVLDKNAAVRVGANAGSLKPADVEKFRKAGKSHDEAIASALCEAALRQCEALEKLGVRNVKVALKCSSVPVTVAACNEFARRTDYPLHLGLTEAGTPARGMMKSACCLGALLMAGIGDTIRVSLTAAPEEEIKAGIAILESCGLRKAKPEIVSCPTCGRTEVDLIGLAEKVEAVIAKLKLQGQLADVRKVAVMGCPVNGPGEARDADLGMAGTRNGGVVIFEHGKILGAFSENEGLNFFEERLRQLQKSCRLL